MPARLADSIREAILNFVFLPGEPLLQKDLADRYGVSRIPLREALRQLAAEGHVVIRPYRSAIVAPLSAPDVSDIAELRSELTQLAIRHAVPELAEAQLRHAEGLLTAMERESNALRWAEQVSELLTALSEPCQRPRLLELLDSLQTQSQRYRVCLFAVPRLRAMSEQSFRRIVAACRRRDPDEAVREIADHFQTLLRAGLEETWPERMLPPKPTRPARRRRGRAPA